jgi:hypothetical protein
MNATEEYVVWLSAMSLAGLARPLRANGDAEARAAAVARSWLNLVDEGGYARSFQQAAPVVRDALTTDQWTQAVLAVRQPLGRCLSRTLRSHKLVQPLSRGPKGPCAVIQFETRFEGKRAAIETITHVRDRDGRWRVAGYFVG